MTNKRKLSDCEQDERSNNENPLNETLSKKTKIEQANVILILDDGNNICDRRIQRIYSDLSKLAVANENYKYLTLNLLCSGNGMYGDEWKVIPKEYLADEYFVRKLVSVGVGFLDVFEVIPNTLWQNEKFIIEMIRLSKGTCFSHFPKRKKMIKTFAKEAIRIKSSNMDETGLNADKDFVREMAKKRVKCLSFISKKLLFDKDFMISIMIENNIKNPDFITSGSKSNKYY